MKPASSSVLVLVPLLLCCGGGTPPASRDAATLDSPSARDTRGTGKDLSREASADASQVPPVQFPRDESPHSDPVEWWYYTGHLKTDGGDRFGFELVVFQWVVLGKAIYMAHFAVTDPQQPGFHLATQTSFVDQRGATSGFDLQVGTSKMSGHAGKDMLSAQLPGYGLEFVLTAKKPVVLQYGSGWMTVGSTKPFYYYSYTRMEVTGSLTVDSAKQAVTGEAWMDHQWGEMGTEFAGWDWFSLRLDDLTEVMLFVVRRNGKPWSYGGTLVGPDGGVQELKQGDFNITALGQWTSPHTQATYPQGWTITVPSAGINATVTPVLADQEFNASTVGSPVYWEGLCTLSGTRQGAPLAGRAYVELSGYKN